MCMVDGSVNEEGRLHALRRYAILDTEPEQAFDDIVSLARTLCDVPMATITFVDRERQWFKAESGLGAKGSAREDSLCTFAVQRHEPLIIKDTLLDPRSASNVFVAQGPKLRFYAGIPLTTQEGFAIGTLCVFDTRPRSLTATQLAGLEALSRQVMALLELRLRMLEREQQATALRTAEKLAVVGRLASSMAHEINNPLQAVTNLLFMAGMSTQDQGALEYLTSAQDELARVTHIVTQTLRFHRQSERAAPARLGELVESVVALFSTRLRHASATVAIEDRQKEMLACYGSDLRQVLANLFGNALDAVSGGQGSKIRVRVRDAQHPGTGEPGVKLVIADNGAGMAPDTQQRLFEPFFSTKGARGTGLGLWVSRGILQKHAADVRVRSTQNTARHGTVFSIFLPLQNGLQA